MELASGMQAPLFELKDQNEATQRLSDYIGKKVVLYFYPKDNTPGCTQEACSFRDNFNAFKQNGIAVLGVSADDSRSHTRFIEKYELPFILLSDTDHQVCELYGVWGKKKLAGHEYMGINRTTFVLDESGKILKIFEKVKPQQHAREILELFGLTPA